MQAMLLVRSCLLVQALVILLDAAAVSRVQSLLRREVALNSGTYKGAATNQVLAVNARASFMFPVNTSASFGAALRPEECGFFDTPMDYVVLAEKSDCVLQSVIKSLHKFASPRRVIIVAPMAACSGSNFSFAPNVHCIDENSVLPGVTKSSTQAWLDEKFGKEVDNMRLGLGSHTMAGWYLQQFLKMGVADAAEKLGLSEDYVLWDSDMVLLKTFCPFNAKGQVNFMEGDTGPENVCNKGYQQSFQRLTGLPYAYSDLHNKGFTTHHMVVNQLAMRDLLKQMSNAGAGKHWSTAILEASCPNLATCSCGFSEYGSYASWRRRLYPAEFTEVPLQYERSSNVADPRVSCCPDHYRTYFERKTKEGLLFVSFERSCNKDMKYIGTGKLPR